VRLRAAACRSAGGPAAAPRRALGHRSRGAFAPACRTADQSAAVLAGQQPGARRADARGGGARPRSAAGSRSGADGAEYAATAAARSGVEGAGVAVDAAAATKAATDAAERREPDSG